MVKATSLKINKKHITNIIRIKKNYYLIPMFENAAWAPD